LAFLGDKAQRKKLSYVTSDDTLLPNSRFNKSIGGGDDDPSTGHLGVKYG